MALAARALDVSVVGELNLDLILYGLPEELVLEREHLANGLALTLGSSSAIFSHNLSVLGTRVGFTSRIGQDSLGEIALERLAAGGVDVSRVRKAAGTTTTGLTVVVQQASGRRYMLTYAGTMFEMNWDDLDIGYLTSARHFHLSSYFLHRTLQPRIPELFATMKARGLTTSLDTNDDPEDRWQGGLQEALKYVDVFLPNEREVCRIAGSGDVNDAEAQMAERVPLLVVKRGERGATARCGGEVFTSAPRRVHFVDAVGAGDSFDAGFIHQFVRGSDIPTCLAWGNMAGAFSTTRPGGTEAFRDRPHFERFFAAAQC